MRISIRKRECTGGKSDRTLQGLCNQAVPRYALVCHLMPPLRNERVATAFAASFQQSDLRTTTKQHHIQRKYQDRLRVSGATRDSKGLALSLQAIAQ